jgi:hypothetical protein
MTSNILNMMEEKWFAKTYGQIHRNIRREEKQKIHDR